jgi:hypothetical protein
MSLTLVVFASLVAGPLQDTEGIASERARTVQLQEDTLHDLRTPLAALSRSIQNLALPTERARALFTERVRYVDLTGEEEAGERVLELDATRTGWGMGAEREAGSEDLSLWGRFLSQVDYFQSAGFYSIRGSFDAEDQELFHSPTGFKAGAVLKDGQLAWVRATLDLDWRRTQSGWRIEAFASRSFELVRTPATLFEDVTADALSPKDRARAQHSGRDAFLVDWVRGVRSGEVDLDEFIAGLVVTLEDGSFVGDWAAVAVVDVDRDGWDDVYAVPGNARPMLFRNRGDGTFEERAERLGLAHDGVVGALFADFDNDGDDDAVLSFFPGRTAVLENRDGRFEIVQDELPHLVAALSVADYDGDGLLDLYLGRYNGNHVGAQHAALVRARKAGGEVPAAFPDMTADESRELDRLLRETGEPFIETPGPPNILLRNVGGLRFERAEGAGPAEPWYQTLAASWSDIDDDGDLDLYVVNEGGPNQLVRNDGEGRFTDITAGGASDIGFGMGASFGDFDADGRSDVYVTNMYSKAGRRIADAMGSEERIRSSARGNSLLRNTGTGFELVQNTEVEAADFGWGGTFCDVNNDGALDIYAPAGYLTMPAEVETVGDT